jgi:hypothetical protein
MHIYVAYFFGALFLANAVPHLVAGLQGRPFQSPFAKPPGEGLSSSRVNALWGFFNLVVGYLLLWHVGSFDLHDFGHAGAVALAVGPFSYLMAERFGRFNGGNNPV